MPKQTQSIERFKGISRSLSATSLKPESGYALDCLNVLPSDDGGNIEKFRCPVTLTSPPSGVTRGPTQFHKYENDDGKQILAFFNEDVYKVALDEFTLAIVDSNALYDRGIMSMVESNNLLFFSNGFATPLKFNGTDLDYWGIQTPDVVATLGSGAGSLNLADGRKYRYSYKNSITGHVGTASAPSASSGAVAGAGITVTIPAPTTVDAQIDLVRIYATLDGGEDYFFLAEIGTAGTPFAGQTYLDNIPDTAAVLGDPELDQSERAPLLNNQPTRAKYLVKWGARIFGINIEEDPKWCWYTGYNRIFVGRPEESVPPGNRLKLETGADDLSGGGIVANGLIVWDKSNSMFQFRGQPEDIVFTAPVEFTLNFQQLPWKIGCASHFSVQSTPAGLVWLTPDRQVRLFDGVNEPEVLSSNVAPLLRRMTREWEFNSRSCYWGVNERSWYVLGVPIDGEHSPNLILVFDMEKDPQSNAGVFPLRVQGAFDSLGVIELETGEQKCLIGQRGRFKELLLNQTTTNGVNFEMVGGVSV